MYKSHHVNNHHFGFGHCTSIRIAACIYLTFYRVLYSYTLQILGIKLCIISTPQRRNTTLLYPHTDRASAKDLAVSTQKTYAETRKEPHPMLWLHTDPHPLSVTPDLQHGIHLWDRHPIRQLLSNLTLWPAAGRRTTRTVDNPSKEPPSLLWMETVARLLQNYNKTRFTGNTVELKFLFIKQRLISWE